jgi:hypothetical protein
MVGTWEGSRRMVSSWERPPRRKTPKELARMSHDDRLAYEIANPMSEHEQWEALEREDAMRRAIP